MSTAPSRSSSCRCAPAGTRSSTPATTSSSSSTAYRDAGVGHVVAEPAQRTVDDYLRSIEALAEIFGAAGVTMTP